MVRFVLTNTDRQVLLAQEDCSGPYNGSALQRSLSDPAQGTVPLEVVLADPQFGSKRRHVRKRLGTVSVIPAKRSQTTWRAQDYRARMRTSFPRLLYRWRALGESALPAVKRKLLARVPGMSLETQRIRALLLRLTHNLYRLRPCLLEAQDLSWQRMSTEPDGF